MLRYVRSQCLRVAVARGQEVCSAKGLSGVHPATTFAEVGFALRIAGI